jgi:hypothetical protein
MSEISFFEDSTASFSIQEIGQSDFVTYIGSFKVKCVLSPIEHIKIDRLYRELLGMYSSMATEHARNLSFALAQLKYRIIQAPPFWKDDEIDGGKVDGNIILKILDQSIECEQKFKDRQKEKLKSMQTKLTEAIKTDQIKYEQEETTNENSELNKLDDLELENE